MKRLGYLLRKSEKQNNLHKLILKSLVTFFCSIFLHLLNWICLFRATGGVAWDGKIKANSLSACGSQRDKEKSLRCGREKRRINAK